MSKASQCIATYHVVGPVSWHVLYRQILAHTAHTSVLTCIYYIYIYNFFFSSAYTLSADVKTNISNQFSKLWFRPWYFLFEAYLTSFVCLLLVQFSTLTHLTLSFSPTYFDSKVHLTQEEQMHQEELSVLRRIRGELKHSLCWLRNDPFSNLKLTWMQKSISEHTFRCRLEFSSPITDEPDEDLFFF